MRGVALKPEDDFRVPEESYAFDNKRMAWETIAPPLDRASPLRTSHLRDPVGPADPFRQRILHGRNGGRARTSIRSSCGCGMSKNNRDIAVIKAAAEKSGWQTRPSPRRDQTGNKVSGRGIAYAQRSGTRVAIVAEVDVDRRSRQDLGPQIHRRA